MRIGIISDTHDRLPTIRAALARFERLGIDALLHPGGIIAPFAARLLADFPATLHVMYGNNDGERADLLVTGHTHQVAIDKRDGKMFVNPGEGCGWVTGRCTVATVDPDNDEVELIEIPT